MNGIEILLIIAILGCFGITCLKFYNAFCDGKFYDLKIGFLLFFGYIFFYLLLFIGMLSEAHTASLEEGFVQPTTVYATMVKFFGVILILHIALLIYEGLWHARDMLGERTRERYDPRSVDK